MKLNWKIQMMKIKNLKVRMVMRMCSMHNMEFERCHNVMCDSTNNFKL